MKSNGFMQRRKGEELIRQRFSNLRTLLKDKKDEAVKSLHDRLEAGTALPKLRADELRLEKQSNKLDARKREVRTQILKIKDETRAQVRKMTLELDQATGTMSSRLDDEERALVESLWVESLSADLKHLLDKVPTNKDLLSNGIGDSLKKLALAREGKTQ